MNSIPRSVGRVFLWVTGASFLPMLLVVRRFEEMRIFDSLGIWYTVVVAAFFAAAAGVVAAIVSALVWRRT